MAYTETKIRNNTKYFYRVKSKRAGIKFKKERIYLGKDLKEMDRLIKTDKADKQLNKTKINNNIKKIKPTILKILKQYKIKKAGIFGSYSVGENTKDSDIDILIQTSRPMGFEFAGMQTELSETLNKKVDLITYKYIEPLIKERILKQEIKIL